MEKIKDIHNYLRVMLKGAIGAIVKNQIMKVLTPFHGKYKKLLEKSIALSFSNKMFLKWFLNQYS